MPYPIRRAHEHRWGMFEIADRRRLQQSRMNGGDNVNPVTKRRLNGLDRHRTEPTTMPRGLDRP